jgi:2,3-bisphosphoglycerate-independent phosphoglycerate mutase
LTIFHEWIRSLIRNYQMNGTRLGPMAGAVMNAYQEGETDEELKPRVLRENSGKARGRISNQDPVIFYDIRGEREIQLSQALTDPSFNHFPIQKVAARLVTMIEYKRGLAHRVAFPPEDKIPDTISETLSRAGVRHMKIMESEKAPHLGYFFNGRHEKPFTGEERIIIDSPRGIANYDECPEMSAEKVAHAVIENMDRKDINLFIINFANVDVVGHIENKGAAIRAVETVDEQIGRVVEAAMEKDITVIVTADHGTVERWLYPDGTIDTGHTTSPVPLIFIKAQIKKNDLKLRTRGELADVPPTILDLLGLEIPKSMTGKDLREKPGPPEKGGRVILIIADGWGYNPEPYGNLIAEARTPVMDRLIEAYPNTLLKASGEAVGLPEGRVGNSEAGHLHLGAGRTIYSDRLRIDRAISSGEFFNNPAFAWAMDISKSENMPLHLLGIVSFYSSHGSLDHLFALMRMAKEQGLRELYIHALLGRRGERPESGARYISKVEEEGMRLGIGKVSTVMGRYFALDREHNWDRVEVAYRALVEGTGTPVYED